MTTYEVNFDGLVGPTHHYAGLSDGNIASLSNALQVANPQKAALQGLTKMRFLHQLGLKQAFLPPQARPNLTLLAALGFTGKPAQQLKKAKSEAPMLLSACYSASSMWTANAATVSASADTEDSKVHFSAANLLSNLHRHQESQFSAQLLEKIFQNEHYFTHHPILPNTILTSDEGAANHNRLCLQHGDSAINVFVYGKQASLYHQADNPIRYPARQTMEASQAIARAHGLKSEHVLLVKQNPQAIDAGVFHNDVISVANESVFLIHEQAFVNQTAIYEQLKKLASFDLKIIEIKERDLNLTEAVRTYLFNSQLITLPDQSMLLLAPSECEISSQVQEVIQSLLAENNPIQRVHYMDLKQSMRNGGGPACLRLRVPLTESELKAVQGNIIINEALLLQLENWVKKHYRERLQVDDLEDPKLITETQTALDELSKLLQLGSIYPFQQ